MKIVALLVAFCFSINVMASTGTVQELERALDNYHYALSVEWDQKDQKVYDAITGEFFQQLEKLIRVDGLTEKEILAMIEAKVKNKGLVDAIKLKMSLMGEATSAEELAQMIKDSSKEFYTKGASWNGQVIIGVGVSVLILAAVGYAIWWGSTHECVRYESEYMCNLVNNCNGGYYTPDGYYFGGVCAGHINVCGYTDVCKEYAKK